MTQPPPPDQPGWGAPPPSPEPEGRRFGQGAVGGGIVIGLVASVAAPLLGVGVPLLGGLGFLVGLLLPVLVGTILMVNPGGPVRRGLGLGIVIGWGVALVVGAGLCVVLIASLGNTA